MSVEDSYRIFPNKFHTLKVAPSLLNTLFNDILCVYRTEDFHNIMLVVEEDEPDLENLIRQHRNSLHITHISAVYYVHISDSKILVAEYLFKNIVFFVYVNVVFVHQTYIGMIKISQYGFRFFFSVLPEDVRRCVLQVSFLPPMKKKSFLLKIKEWLKCQRQ